ncbi:peptidoglycan DD-metalloendopeptidase family protein [Thiolapillus sp.]
MYTEGGLIDISCTRSRARCFLGFLVLLVLPGMMTGCATHKVPDRKPQHATARSKAPIRKPGGYYRVRKGDSLYSIAWRAGLDYRTLARWNGLKPPYTIYPGQLIRLAPPKRKKLVSSAGSASGKAAAVAKPAGKPEKPKSRASTNGRKAAKAPKKAAGGALRWQWPVRGRILSRFASNDATRGGIKIGGRKGQKIVAAEAGQVVYVGSGLIGYGQLIIIKHNNKYLSAYGHNSRLRVKEGDKVSRGQHISDMGVTNGGTPLLYFEIRRYGKPVDPLKYLPR